jgi:4-hydroxysphinganine ceramide fatty acyl 2-hydroxylase
MLLGIIINYQFYDLGHYYVHHANPKDGSYFKMMKLYHMQHHYKYGTIGFGVSSKFWDVVFNTEIVTGLEKKKSS